MRPRRGGAAVLFARGFFRYYGIDFSKSRRFRLAYDEKQSLHVLEPE